MRRGASKGTKPSRVGSGLPQPTGDAFTDFLLMRAYLVEHGFPFTEETQETPDGGARLVLHIEAELYSKAPGYNAVIELPEEKAKP